MRPPKVGTKPGANDAAAVAEVELTEAGYPGGAEFVVDNQQVKLLPAFALPGAALDIRQRLLDLGVRAPGEPTRHLRIGRQLKQGGGVVLLRRAQSQTWACQRESHDYSFAGRPAASSLIASTAMEQPDAEVQETVSSVGELDFAVVTLREFLHHSNAVRALAVVDREPGVGPATIDCERFCAIEVDLGDRIVLIDHGAELEPTPAVLPEVKPLPPFNVDPVSGEIAGTIGGIEHLVDGVSALATALGGRNVAMAVFETDSAEYPLSITARADGSEEPVIALGDQAFTLPPVPGT